MMDRLTDKYGNLKTNVTGSLVICKLAEFYVLTAHLQGLTWWIVMDKTKPYKILDEADPMRVCVEQGNYMIQAALCRKG